LVRTVSAVEVEIIAILFDYKNFGLAV